MPKFGLSMEEGTIANWLVKEGDSISKGQAIAEINSEKLTNNAEAEEDGVLLKILVQEDETVTCGTPIAIMGQAGEDIGSLASEGAAAESAADNADAAPVSAAAVPDGVHMIPMQKFGLSMEEGTIASWLVKEGDMISKGQAIAEVNSEKLTNNAESEFDGVLLKIIVAEDESAACGETIAIIGPAGTDVSGLTGQAASATAPEAAPVETTSAPAAKPAADVVITPRAKKYAEEKGLAYAHIVGTGIGGAITIDDVKKNGKPAAEVKIEKPAPAPAAPAKPAAAPTPAKPAPSQIKAPVLPGDNVMAMSQMQMAICKGMYSSLQGSAQITIATESNVENLTKVYKSLKGKYKASGIKLSYTALLVKAVAMALENHEAVRTQYVDEKHVKIVNKIDIGVAVDVPNGLIVPVIRDANLKDLRSICIDLADISERAKENKLTQDDLGGAVITITNLGMFNITYFTPILNAPETAILGTGAIIEKPVIHDGGIFIEHVMNLSLTHDHRISNGAPCARFLKEVSDNLQDFKWM